MLTHKPPESDLSRQKATLFCPNCGHKSHVSGDWRVAVTESSRRYVCPDCRWTVTERPRS